MRGYRIGLAVALLCAGVSAARAQLAQQIPTLYQTNVPGWVLGRGFGVPAALDYDFANNRYYEQGVSLCTSSASCVVVSRGSTGTNLLPTSPAGFAYATFAANTPRIMGGAGLLVEEARTNQLKNSAAPATQTTGSLGTGTYTLWVNGAGSATMSAGTGTGCGSGAATQGSPVNFTITGAGTCTVTVVGSLSAFQLEAGSFGTSFIVTAGATATRAADVVTTALTVGASYTFSAIGTPLAPASFAANQSFFALSDGTSSNRIVTFRAATTGSVSASSISAGVNTGFSPGTAWATGAVGKLAVTSQPGATAAVFNAGTAATAAPAAQPVGINQIQFGANGAALGAWDGYISRAALWPSTALPTARLQQLTQ